MGTKQTSLREVFELKGQVKEEHLAEQHRIDCNEDRPV